VTRSRWVFAIWLLGLAVCAGVVARTHFTTDMQAFLPRAPRPAQQILVDQLREGVVSRLVLVLIEAQAPERATALSRTLAEKLRGDPQFALVANGDQSALGRERDLVWGHRYLLSPAVEPDRFTAPGLRRALDEDLRLLGSDLGLLIKRALPSDPTGEALGLIQSLAGQSHAATRDGVWVTRDGRAALLMVSTRAAGFDIDAQEQALGAIRAAFAALPDAARARLVATGPPVFAVQSRDRIKGDAELFSTIATVLVTLVLLLAYRSARVLGLALLPVASGALAGVAAVSLAFGYVHGITLGFGVTLIGEAVDYAIYLFTQTRPGESPRATLPRVWSILRLGMLISVCGFSAMLFSGFSGFAQLGLFTIAGLVVALAVTRFVLPDLLDRGFSAIGGVGFAWPVLVLMRHGPALRWAVLGMALLAGLSLALHRGPFWEDQLASMSPIPQADLAVDARLRAELGAPDVRHLLVLDADSREAALQASARVGALLQPLVVSGLIASFNSPARFLPSQAAQESRRAALPDAATLSANLAEAVIGTPFRAESFAPFLADVAAARQGALLSRADLDGTSLALQADTLLIQHGPRFVALLPLSAVRDSAAAEVAIGKLAVPGLTFVDLARESNALLASYRAEAVTLSLAGSLVITLLLAAALRTPRRILAVLVPLAAAVLCTAAIDLLIAQRLSIFNLFGLLLVVAVGSNYALFFERAARTPTPEGARVVASLVLADLCTIIGFGVLGFSQVPVLGGIGATVAIGACLSLLFAAVIGPRAL
jgi:predicted exporter